MPDVTTILVRCNKCHHAWHQSLSIGIIGANNGDTITVSPRAINVECPKCQTQVVNRSTTTANVTGESLHGFIALLKPLTSAELEELAAIIGEASESGASADVIAERIKTSIPSLRPILAWMISQQGAGVGTWIQVLLTVLVMIMPMQGSGAPTAPVEYPVIIIENQSGEEQQINDLQRQIAELRSAWNAKAPATDDQEHGDRGKHH
jgi:hypothetical protein